MNYRTLKGFFALIVGVSATLLNGCGDPKMEKCRLNEVEPREIEINIRDTDIEGWELEVLCGDSLWDIPWGEINRNFKIDIKDYYSENPQQAEQKLQQLSQRLVLYKQEGDRSKLIYGSVDGNPELISIKANRDD